MSVAKPLRVGVVLLSAVAALLTGCSDDQPQAQPPTTSATPEASASASPTEPTPPALPAAAQEDTKQGAEAFVGYYIQALNHAANTGQVHSLTESAVACEGCDRYIDFYERTYKEGGSFSDPGWEPITWFVHPQGDQYVVLTEVKAPAATYYPAQGKPRKGTKDEFDLRFTIRRHADSWLVTSLTGA